MKSEDYWNRYHENLLQKWAERSKTYSIMHSLCAQYYVKYHKRLGIPVVILGGITSSSIFSSNQEHYSMVWNYVNGVLSLLVAALIGISSFMNISEKITKHQTAAFKYTKIAMDIDELLSFGRQSRFSAPQSFIRARKSEMLDIRENAPEVLSWIMTRYIKKMNKSLTNVRSKVNKTSHGDKTRLIDENISIKILDDEELICTGSEKSAKCMKNVSRQIKNMQEDSDFEVSDDDDEAV